MLRRYLIAVVVMVLGHMSFAEETLVTATPEQLKALVLQLGDENFEKRNEAEKALMAIGDAAMPALKKAAKATTRRR